MSQVIILRGPSGAGKSTLAKAIQDKLADIPTLCYCPDNFFMEDGQYKFDPSKLGEAHSQNFYKFIEDLRLSTRHSISTLFIIDATNTRQGEYSPYYLAAEAYGAKPLLVEVVTDIEDCIRDNVHEVPPHAVRNQHKRMEEPAPFHRGIKVKRNTPVEEIISKVFSPSDSEGA